MKDQHSYTCIQWAHQRFLRSAKLNGGASTIAASWVWSFGKVAGQVHNYLESGHLRAEPLPASLVHEILGLAQSSYGRFPAGDVRRVLIDTWRGLAHVYGAADFGNREMDRLKMLTDWAEAIEALRYSGFPGLPGMVAAYGAERRRLDLTKLRPGLHNFKYVGVLLDLLKLYEPRPRPTCTSVVGKRVDIKKPTASRSGRSAMARDGRSVRLAKPSTAVPAIELHGNWRDHWSNTLPEMV
ncbi:hypothetical protein [Arthrobacter sp. AD-310]